MAKIVKTTSNRLPRHVEISEMLAREIQAGILLDGSRLPPERQMAEKLDVAVGTLRKALLDLTEKGLLERVHGSGNYVRSDGTTKDAQANTIYGFFRLELIEGGGLPTAEVLTVDKIKKPTDIGNIGDDKFAHRIRRLRRLNDVDAALEEIWIDGAKRSKIVKADLSDSLYLFYKEELGHWITNAEDNVSVSNTPAWKPEEFGTKITNETQVWGYIERFSCDQNNKCVEFSRTWFDPQTTRFVARWQ